MTRKSLRFWRFAIPFIIIAIVLFPAFLSFANKWDIVIGILVIIATLFSSYGIMELRDLREKENKD